MLARSGGIAAWGLALALAAPSRIAADDPASNLRPESPSLARRYEASLTALAEGRPAEASRGFARVLEDAPDFAPALRRRCDAERELGHFDLAIALCGRAVERQPTAENLLATSRVLTLRGRARDLERASALADRALRIAPLHRGALVQRLELAALSREREVAAEVLARAEGVLEARRAAEAHVLVAHLALEDGAPQTAMLHARRAVALDPDLYEAHAVVASAALEIRDIEALRVASPAMLRLAPEGAYAHYVAGVVAAEDGSFREARAHVERARALGMEPASCDELLADIDRRAPMAGGVLRPMAVALAVGSSLLVVLFAAAGALGRATSRRLGAAGGDLGRFDARGGRALRVAYRRVLWAAAGFGYLFLPLMSVLVAGAVAAALQALLAAGTLRVGLAIVLLLVGAFVLFAVIEASFLRPRERPPNERIDSADNPRLDRLLRDVAARVGVRPVESAYATPGAELAMVDRGTIAALLRGRGERTLHVGVALLDALSVRELEILLAHEYAHLRSAGGAGGALATSLSNVLASMEQVLRESGAASALNPAWLVLRGCHRVLRFVARGAVRLQAARADEWVARAFGGLALASALRSAVTARARFEAHAYQTLDEVVSTSRALSNLYTYRTNAPPDEAWIAETIERRWNEGDGAPDRPPPAHRVGRFSSAPPPAPVETTGASTEEPAWALFDSREALETAMTEALRNDLARKGVLVAESDEGDAPFEPDPRPAAVGE